jgi:hypothetical protein
VKSKKAMIVILLYCYIAEKKKENKSLAGGDSHLTI